MRLANKFPGKLQGINYFRGNIYLPMGFNIGVYPAQGNSYPDCRYFIDRAFYDFVNSGESYGDQSILLQSGKYYGLDLSPLLKLVYTWDEVPADYIKENTQNTDFLLHLTQSFRDKIQQDPLVCDHITYDWREESINLSSPEMQELLKNMEAEQAAAFTQMLGGHQDPEENTNPWKEYFEQGQIVEDLNNLVKGIQCYKDKGIDEIYLTAG